MFSLLLEIAILLFLKFENLTECGNLSLFLILFSIIGQIFVQNYSCVHFCLPVPFPDPFRSLKDLANQYMESFYYFAKFLRNNFFEKQFILANWINNVLRSSRNFLLVVIFMILFTLCFHRIWASSYFFLIHR